MTIGDTINLILGTYPYIPGIKELVGGLPKIVENGKDISLTSTIKEGGGEKFITTRHPRTAVGFSKDSTKLFFTVVDGRQSSSVGMSLPELSTFMISVGCYQAINLDGGGSTTLMVRNKTMNSPSDLTGQRAVGNVILLISRKGK